jgi:hypothetical protein
MTGKRYGAQWSQRSLNRNTILFLLNVTFGNLEFSGFCFVKHESRNVEYWQPSKTTRHNYCICSLISPLTVRFQKF